MKTGMANPSHPLRLSLISLGIGASLIFSNLSQAETIWIENFDDPVNEGKGAINNVVDLSNITKWSIDVSAASLTANDDWFVVKNQQFDGRDLDGNAIWLSESIDISGKQNLQISVDASEDGSHEADDYLDLAYSIDGGEFITITNWNGKGDSQHTLVDDFTAESILASVPSGTTLQIRISMKNNAGTEYLRFDNVTVSGDAGGNSGGDTGGGDSGSDVISGACFNCPDLSKIANAANFDSASYYASVTNAIANGQTSVEIREALQSVLSNGHKQLSYSEVWTALTQTDEDPTNSDNVVLIYKGNSIAKMLNGSGTQSNDPDNWNREHVWAKSHGFPDSNQFAYTDIHHLRPSDISVNASRGNLDFDFSDGALSEAPENRVDSDSFEPRASVKGDVARMVFYMDVRYSGIDGNTPDLEVVNQLTSSGEARLGKLCALLAWHDADPVDQFEQNRNDRIYEFQGNRNPFIDHPEWVATFFNTDCTNTGGGDTGGGDNGGDTGGDTGGGTNPEPGNSALFFSEYVEGSGFNKAVEIYNPTADTISLNGYEFRLYSNGGTNITASHTLSGEILPYDVRVIALNNAGISPELAGYADEQSGAINFNGDDYFELVNGETLVDSFGQYGVRLSWASDMTLVRKPNVTSGDINRDDEFVRDNEWVQFPKDTFNNLGSHQMDSGNTDPDPDAKVLGVCGATADFISAIQGNGDVSPVENSVQVIEAIVTTVAPDLKGIFVQEELTDYDQDSTTSEALFVYLNTSDIALNAGDKVRVIGDVKEQYGRTQLAASEAPLVCGTANAVSPVALSLPISSNEMWEQLEGMLVSFAQDLKVTDNYDLARFGQMILSSERLIIPTNIYAPGTEAAINLADRNSRNKIMVDDRNNSQNPDFVPFPTPQLSYTNSLRLGDTVSNLTGVLDYSYSNYRILPTSPLSFSSSNGRSSAPSLSTQGNLTVASFNVLNLFNGDGLGQGFPTSRGASSFDEYQRQLAKTVSAINAINADVVGLMEIENDGFGPQSAIAQLVDALNLAAGTNNYAYVDMGLPNVGGDHISSGIIYKPSVVTPVGVPATTEQIPFDYGNRPPVAQSFSLNSNNETFTLVVNHLKAKGGCSSATGANTDQGDGQGCWVELRTQAVNTTLAWLATNPTQISDDDVLMIGDFNSYGMETPINTLTSNGYHNLVAEKVGINAYSYAFAGEIGYLDHALASDELAPQVTAAAIWHINADEPRAFDYNTEYKSAQQLIEYYGDSAYRASDHDPVVVAINLESAQELVGDLDLDGDIDMADIQLFMAMLRTGQALDIKYDFNADGKVNLGDVKAMMNQCTRSKCAI